MKITATKAKARAWKVFSRYIRVRDALRTVGNNLQCKCISCDTIKNVSGRGCIQAGHFIAGRYGAVLFHEELVHGQCLTKESNLRLFNGKDKPINRIKAGDRLWGFNEKTFQREFCLVESVKKFIPKELYKVSLENGNEFYATPDHKFVANGKWYQIKDVLHNCTVYDILEL